MNAPRVSLTFAAFGLPALLSILCGICPADEPNAFTAAAGKDPPRIEQILRDFHDPKSKKVLVIAHRGGWRHAREYEAPENSLANIDKAVRLGYDVFETDVSRTKDGQYVLMHDPSVARTTNGTGKVRDLTLAEIKKLRLRYSGKKTVTDQTVPTFREALARGKDRIMFKIDLKCDLQYLGDVLDELHQSGCMRQALIRVNSRGSSIRKVKQVLASSPNYAHAMILFRCTTSEQVQRIIDEFHPPAIEIQGAEHGITDQMRQMARLIQKSGARVEAHASDNADDWPTQIDAGIRAFHTKRPRQMVQFLRMRGLHD